MEKARHKFQIDQTVFNRRTEDTAVIKQKRYENGHLCYRLDDGSIIHENFLYTFESLQKEQLEFEGDLPVIQ